MKKLLLTLAVAAGFGFSSYAEEVTESFAKNDAAWFSITKTQASDTPKDLTSSNTGITYSVTQAYYNQDGYVMLVKSKGILKFKLDFDCANITIYSKANASASQAVAVYAGETEIKGSSKIPNVADGNLSVDVPEANQAAGTEYSIKVSTANNVQVTKIVYTLAGGVMKKDAGLSFPEAKYEVNLGQAFTAPALTKATNAAVTYASDKETVATVDATTGAVTLVGEGTARITATAEANDEYRAGSASYLLTVVDPNKPGATISNPMTVAQALEACTSNGPKNVYVKGIVTKVTTAFDSQYNNVSFNIGDEVGSTEILEAYRTKWGADVTPTDDKNPAVGATVILFGNLKIFNGKKELDANNQIVSYTAPALPSAGLSFPEKTYTINLGEAFTAPELTKATDAAAAYTSSNPAVADVDAATGAVTVKTYGSTVITAKTAETAAYLAGEASYTLVVNNPAITIDAPLTVAQALEVCANEPHNVYVKGIVTKIVTPYDSQYKNVSFNIADEAGATEVLLAYRTKWGEGVTATADNNPEVGATVVIYGDLKIHNDIKEFNANNMIVKYNIPTGIEDIEIEANAPVEYFNLQGVRVANPENGLYIRRQGNKVSKVIVK